MGDCRHVKAYIQAGGETIRLHNFYVPAGGDEPDVAINPKFDHKPASSRYEFHSGRRGRHPVGPGGRPQHRAA